MYKVFNNQHFWLFYSAICAITLFAAVAISNYFGLSGKVIEESSNKDAWLIVAILLMPSGLLPGFAIVGLLQKLKR